jgi:putative DNA primase/helicase
MRMFNNIKFISTKTHAERALAYTRIENLHERFAPAEIYGKMALITEETEGKANVTKWIKNISDGAFMIGEWKYGAHFGFKPFCKIVFSTNKAPKLTETKDYAVTRRLIKLDFTKKFVDSNPDPARREMLKDPRMEEKITTDEELSGLLNEVVARAPELISTNAVYTRKTHESMADEYDIQSQSIERFEEECCEIHIERDEYGRPRYIIYTEISMLYDAYKAFCARYNVTPESRKNLIKYFRTECKCDYTKRKISDKSCKTRQPHILDGVALKPGLEVLEPFRQYAMEVVSEQA